MDKDKQILSVTKTAVRCISAMVFMMARYIADIDNDVGAEKRAEWAVAEADVLVKKLGI